MIDKKAVLNLTHQDAFVAFLEEVLAIRESQIQALHEATTDKVQQISGRILQCDEILQMGCWQDILDRRRQ